jgi:chaperonin cofactor prefoldin
VKDLLSFLLTVGKVPSNVPADNQEKTAQDDALKNQMNELFTILVNLRHQILHEEKTAGVIDDVRAEQAMFKDSVLGIDLT